MFELDVVLARFGGRLWDAPAFLPDIQAPLCSDALRDVQERLGVKLPSLYVALCKQQNGGALRASHGPSSALAGIGAGASGLLAYRARWKPAHAGEGGWSPDLPELLIPFDGDGHWDHCLDYRSGGPLMEPAVTRVSAETKDDVFLAPSFGEYLLGLEDSYKDTLKVAGAGSPERLASRIAGALGGEGPVSDGGFADGCLSWSMELPGEGQSVWLNANRVPVWFYRQGFAVVISPDTTLQLPERPECDVVVWCSDGSRQAVWGYLCGFGLEVVS